MNPPSLLANGNDIVPRNLIWIVVDTLRADYLSCYDGRGHTPSMDRLAGQGAKFLSAYSHIPITLPSHYSMFTGVYPRDHGVLNNAERYAGPWRTIAEIFQERGFYTAAFVSLGALDQTNIGQGFSEFNSQLDQQRWTRADDINRAVIPWLEDHYPQPFFLFTHYSDPHEPYAPPGQLYPYAVLTVNNKSPRMFAADALPKTVEITIPPGRTTVKWIWPGPIEGESAIRLNVDSILFQGMKYFSNDFRADKRDLETKTITLANDTGQDAEVIIQFTLQERLGGKKLRARYGEEVSYVDEYLGILLEKIKNLGIAEDTLIVFSSDHGEGLREHLHTGHIENLYDELTKVPLVFVWSKGIPEGIAVRDNVGLVDVLPTILEIFDQPVPENIRGKSLLSLIRGNKETDPRSIFLETHQPEANHNLIGMRWKNFKYIRNITLNEEELYCLNLDSKEWINIFRIFGYPSKKIKNEIAAISPSYWIPAKSGPEDISEDQKTNLRSLGYMH